MNNTFGNIFTLTSFGESHGKAIGGVIDDEGFVRQELARRRPGQSALTTGRQEADAVEFLSGIYKGVSTGCPIGFVVWNTNQHSADYDNMKDVFRPSHADFTYTQKYGIRDHRRSSARETISRVVAGALAKLALKEIGVQITAFTSQVGTLALDKDYAQYDFGCIEKNPVRCPDPELARQMEGISTANGRTYPACKGRRRYHRRRSELRHPRMPHWIGTTRIRETSCRIGERHASPCAPTVREASKEESATAKTSISV